MLKPFWGLSAHCSLGGSFKEHVNFESLVSKLWELHLQLSYYSKSPQGGLGRCVGM